MAITFTQAQLTAMTAAYARGVVKVRHGDKTVDYGTMADLWAAIQRMQRAIASPAQPSYVRLTSKGY